MKVQYLKQKDAKGRRPRKEIRVHCSWTDLEAGNIYLHESGLYGYIDGSPVRTREELAIIIREPLQRKYALFWWDKLGERLSREFYRANFRKEERRKQILLCDHPGEPRRVELVRYQCRHTKKLDEKAYSDPGGWSSFGFDEKPHWWGIARTVQIGDWYFRRCDLAEKNQPENCA